MLTTLRKITILLFVENIAAYPQWRQIHSPRDYATKLHSHHGSNGVLCETALFEPLSEATAPSATIPSSPSASSGLVPLPQTALTQVTVPRSAATSPVLTIPSPAGIERSQTLTITASASSISEVASTTVPFDTPIVYSTAVQSPTTSVQQAALPVASKSTTGSVSADMLVAIDSTTSSCDNPPEPGQCATAAQAAFALNSAFSTYGMTSKAAQAAVVAWEMYESGAFKYNVNVFPGVPGQGTRDMMSPTFVAAYATYLFGAAMVAEAGDPASILALANASDEDSFGSGAWFLSTKCPSVLALFDADPDTAWTAFLGPGCISTTDNAQRDQYWQASKLAFGV